LTRALDNLAYTEKSPLAVVRNLPARLGKGGRIRCKNWTVTLEASSSRTARRRRCEFAVFLGSGLPAVPAPALRPVAQNVND
jgi:hypothetical protein